MTQSCTEAWSRAQGTNPPGALIHPTRSRHPQEGECPCRPPAGCMLQLGQASCWSPTHLSALWRRLTGFSLHQSPSWVTALSLQLTTSITAVPASILPGLTMYQALCVRTYNPHENSKSQVLLLHPFN